MDDHVIAVYCNKEVPTARRNLEINDTIWDEESQSYRRFRLAAAAPLGEPEEDLIYAVHDRLFKTEKGLARAISDPTRPYSSLTDEPPMRHEASLLVQRLVLSGISRLRHSPPIEKLEQRLHPV